MINSNIMNNYYNIVNNIVYNSKDISTSSFIPILFIHVFIISEALTMKLEVSIENSESRAIKIPFIILFNVNK